MNKLQEIIEKFNLGIKDNPEYGTDKGFPKSYIDEFYEKSFSGLVDKDITLVEIGVRSGSSLKMWREYFSKAKIIGIDNFSDLNNHQIPINNSWIYNEDVQFICGDAYDKDVSDRIENIDILIDDGPHTFESHVKTLELYLPKINLDGMVIIEDVSYNPNNLFDYVPDNLKDTSFLYDFGGYDNRLIVIEVKDKWK